MYPGGMLRCLSCGLSFAQAQGSSAGARDVASGVNMRRTAASCHSASPLIPEVRMGPRGRLAGSTRKTGRPSLAAAALEELHRALVLLGRLPVRKGAEVAALAGARVLLAGIQPVFSRLELADHGPSGCYGRSINDRSLGWVPPPDHPPSSARLIARKSRQARRFCSGWRSR